ncbi:hypothetical protein ACOSQ2_005127 [Xanthoceras sorbifolium]
MRYSVFEYFHQTHGGCVSLCTSTNTRRSLERETHDGEKSKQCEEKHAKTGGEKTTDEDRLQGKPEAQTGGEEDSQRRRDRLRTQLANTTGGAAPQLAGGWLGEAAERRW